MSAARKIELAISKELIEKLAAERELSTRLYASLEGIRKRLEPPSWQSPNHPMNGWVPRKSIQYLVDEEALEAFRGARGTHE